MSTSDSAVAAATGRTPGYDVARAFALYGMILVNFHGRAQSETAWYALTEPVLGELEGRAAALFVMLAGVGVSLRSRDARRVGGPRLAEERWALLRRAAALLAVGLLNLHLWDWDILHVYALYLTAAAGLIAASRRTLVGVGVLVFGASVVLRALWPEPYEPLFWSLGGFFQSVVFVGNHPALPWLCFLLVGIGLGRLDLRRVPLRRRLLAVAAGGVALAEGGSRVAQRIAEQAGAEEWTIQWLSTWPRPPGPFFVLSSTAVAVVVILLSIEWSEANRQPRAVMALTAAGQLALSLYFAHEVGILIPLEHSWLEEATAEAVALYGTVFFLAGVAGATWWRRRNRQGPFESILRQLSARSRPAWGGALMEK